MSRGVAFLEKQTAAIVASNAPKTDAAASSTAATSTATTAPVDALATLCQVLYGGNEFLYVD
jgi:hypothetical protein